MNAASDTSACQRVKQHNGCLIFRSVGAWREAPEIHETDNCLTELTVSYSNCLPVRVPQEAGQRCPFNTRPGRLLCPDVALRDACRDA